MESTLRVPTRKREHMGNAIRIRKYTLNSLATLTVYIDKCITDLNYLQDNGIEIDEMYHDLIYDFNLLLSDNLEVRNYKEYKQIKNYVKRADIVLESAFQDKDPGPIISSFDKLKRNLIKLNVLKKTN